MTDSTFPKCPKVALIRGDGIGPEIADATVQMLAAAGAQIDWVPVAAGMSALTSHGDPLPQESLDILTACGVALKAPLGTPTGGGFKSINVSLRQHFDLYANLRPAKSIPGVPSRFADVDLVLVRENTEGIYTAIDRYLDPEHNTAESISIVTRAGSERVVRFALEYATRHKRKKVTLVHKANILKKTSGLFLAVGQEVSKEYPAIDFETMIVDAAAMNMVVDPTRFDVIVTTNLFGDILSDLAAGLIGGLGVAPAGNFGAGGRAIFEAVHGTAPDIAGKGIANPCALALSACMLLDHVGQGQVADRLRQSIVSALGQSATRTGDLGGSANTQEFADAVIKGLA